MTDWSGRLEDDLCSRGAEVGPVRASGEFTIVGYRGMRFSAPVTVTVDPGDFAGYLRWIESDAATVFGTDRSSSSAYRLAVVHVEELLLSLRQGLRRVTFTDGHIEAIYSEPVDKVETPLGTGGHRWVLEEPDTDV